MRRCPADWSTASGDLRYAQTMAFTTLMLFQLFNVFNARSDETSAFDGPFSNRWLWAAIGLSLALQVAVVYAVPPAGVFDRGADGLRLAAVSPRGESVLWLRELSKVFTRPRQTAIRRRR